MAEKRYEADHVPAEMETRLAKLIRDEVFFNPLFDGILKLMDELVEQNISDCDSCARVDPADYCPEPQYAEGRG